MTPENAFKFRRFVSHILSRSRPSIYRVQCFYVHHFHPLNYTTWQLTFSELRYPKVKPKMAVYEASLGDILSSVERAVDFIF